jgi:hypothetical protein
MSVLRTSLLLPALFLSACAAGPSTAELNPKFQGMSKQQLLSCMGPPHASAKDGNMEFLTYQHRDIYDKYTYRCDANFVLTDGRVSRLSITGDAPGTLDVTSGVCRAIVSKCAP